MNAQTACPQCGAEIPVYEGVRPWCDRCDWNLGGETLDPDEGFLGRQYFRLSERYGRVTIEKLKATATGNLRPRWTRQKLIAFAIAASIHLLSLTLFTTGIVIVVAGFPEAAAIFWGAVMCTFAWLMRPKPGKVPTQDIIDPKDFPALHGFVNEVARVLRGQPITRIIVNEDFNAAYSVVGWRRMPVLWIGLPLWLALRPQERLAVIGHEIAHGVNNDATRGLVIFSALSALHEWIGLLQNPFYHATTPTERFDGYVTWLLSLPFVAVQSLLVQLLYLDKQQAEYFADYLASTVAGTETMVATLRRLGCGEHLGDVLLRNAYSTSQSGARILALFQERIANLPAREWQRLARAGLREGARLDDTHPPTAYRIEFLKAHVVTEPRIVAADNVMRAIDAELITLQERLGHRLIAYYSRD